LSREGGLSRYGEQYLSKKRTRSRIAELRNKRTGEKRRAPAYWGKNSWVGQKRDRDSGNGGGPTVQKTLEPGETTTE